MACTLARRTQRLRAARASAGLRGREVAREDAPRRTGTWARISAVPMNSVLLNTCVFHEAIFSVGVSRRDKKGIVQANFISKNYNKIVKYSDISNVTSEYPLLKKGITAIIDANDGHYLSHTNFKLTNTLSAIPLDKFQKNVGTISSNSTNSNVIIRYKKYKDYVILGIVDKTEVYSRRNSVTIWTVLCCLSLSLTSILSIRKHLIDVDLKKQDTYTNMK